MIGEPLLSVRDLSVWYGERHALSDVDLEVHSGEVVALAGENGAGKSTLVRAIAGDLAPADGELWFAGERLRGGTAVPARRGIAVVWQDLALCDNLDVASNLLLGRERTRLMLSEARFHARARDLLASLEIPLTDTTRPVSSLSGGQRQLLAVARAMRDRPRLLILDEPTAALGVFESAQVESLTHRLSDEGTTILLVSHDIDQMFRLADRIAVLRQGRLVADVPTVARHPDEIVALMSGQAVDSSPRRQLDRLHSLVGRLSTGDDPRSSLAVILSALGTALAAERLCIHLLDAGRLRLTAQVGLASELVAAWSDLPVGEAGGPPGAAAARRSVVIDAEVRAATTWSAYRPLAEHAGIRSSWSVPVMGGGGLLGVITVFGRSRGAPHRDELDLVTLYAGYAASAAERDRLLGEVTARNQVLETIREVLEELSGPGPLAEGLNVAVAALRLGLGASVVALLQPRDDERWQCRGCSDDTVLADPQSVDALHLDESLVATARDALDSGRSGVIATTDPAGRPALSIRVTAPDGPMALVASFDPAARSDEQSGQDAGNLLVDAARSLELALERETSERSHREATALRRSQELQRDFLSRLSHELRTPLTAIHGYADSLLQTDVSWDEESQSRFLRRIAGESARLGRLVTDLLDVSAIESNVMRLQRDWCELPLVIDAARACLPLEVLDRVALDCGELPSVWADHDRLEQVLVNLMDNAVRHNPVETHVTVTARSMAGDTVCIVVADDGIGLPHGAQSAAADASNAHSPAQRRPTAGAGLGLSIARAIVAAHDGTLELEPTAVGTAWRIHLPVGGGREGSELLSGVVGDG